MAAVPASRGGRAWWRSLAGVLASCSVLAGSPAISLGAPVLRYVSTLVGIPPLGRPISVTPDSGSAEVCVTDEGTCAIDVFDAHGLHRFGTNEMAGLSMPMDACIDAQSRFVFTDFDPERKRTIRRLNFLGEPDAFAPEIPREGWSPSRLIVTRDGHYVTVDGEGLLAKHDASTGALIWRRELVEPTWERSDLLGRPAEAADGRLYVPNAGSGMVEVVTADGSSQVSFGRRGTKRGELAFPVGVAFGKGNLVLVLDRMKQCIVCYDTTQRFVVELGKYGLRTGEIYFPSGIAAGTDGRVYIAQAYGGRVQVFRMEDEASPEAAPPPASGNGG